MDFDDLFTEQLRHVQQAFQDFEALKRVWIRSQAKSVDSFSDYSEDIPSSLPVLYSPFETDERQLSPYICDDEDMDSGQDGDDKPWNKYVAFGENMADHQEVAPPRLMTDYSMVDAEDPIFARGAALGIPNYNSLHIPYGGSLLLMQNSGYKGYIK